jgi:hypothetical protein
LLADPAISQATISTLPSVGRQMPPVTLSLRCSTAALTPSIPFCRIAA